MEKKTKLLTVDDVKTWENFTKKVDLKIKKNVGKNQSKVQPILTEKYRYLDFEKDVSTFSYKTKNDSIAKNKAIDKKVYAKLKSGKMAPEEKLDLHGMKYETAYNSVRSFIFESFERGARLLLIVTGKGQKQYSSKKWFDGDIGILRKSLPNWLESDELRPIILNVSSAHISHSGSGAYYVYLKKNKLQRT